MIYLLNLIVFLLVSIMLLINSLKKNELLGEMMGSLGVAFSILNLIIFFLGGL